MFVRISYCRGERHSATATPASLVFAFCDTFCLFVFSFVYKIVVSFLLIKVHRLPTDSRVVAETCRAHSESTGRLAITCLITLAQTFSDDVGSCFCHNVQAVDWPAARVAQTQGRHL